jgi:hypothetical protein
MEATPIDPETLKPGEIVFSSCADLEGDVPATEAVKIDTAMVVIQFGDFMATVPLRGAYQADGKGNSVYVTVITGEDAVSNWGLYRTQAEAISVLIEENIDYAKPMLENARAALELLDAQKDQTP